MFDFGCDTAQQAPSSFRCRQVTGSGYKVSHFARSRLALCSWFSRNKTAPLPADSLEHSTKGIFRFFQYPSQGHYMETQQ